MEYMFPEYRAVPTCDAIMSEYQKVAEEAIEAMDAWAADEDIETCAMELFDVIHACETCLRMLDRKFPELDLDVACAKVIEKNLHRGYYG